MAITAEMVKQLREQTGAGMMDSKKALEQFGGDMAKAAAWLKEKGLAAAEKKASREAKEGMIEVYSHMGGRLAVMVEVNCETDFVARMSEFRELAHNLALQIASAAPTYVKKEDVPAEVIAAQTAKFKEDAIAEGKKPEIAERIAAGRMEKFYQDHVLMEQVFVKDDKVKVKDLIAAAIAKCGENIQVRRFVRYQLGEES
ncbi:MAG: translation elongation factor Ts [Chloroflexi bacterium]|jgi:elongation factor Ts|uniref:Elongation factor Ts n=1 Tax=Candidatus Thermofonsia Clade 3 bacterium TaxID=2364212 RepID=A0A2M8QF33_9CHLR|nr:translation elongation factor Ts [Candidatus Roseilinea sp. NK_OTU-006]PJF48404.1 MAG: translation elongation factor Ts [Candidatus Thermofonsia Clade 3 bacterium]RMG65211.1 MAG: translation elongation factor Ts [Chloroflexota bacterium]